MLWTYRDKENTVLAHQSLYGMECEEEREDKHTTFIIKNIKKEY